MTSKLLKKVSLVLLMGLTLSQLSACKKAEPIVANEEDKMKGTLSVYYVDYADQNAGGDEYVFETTGLLQELQNKYPDLEVIPTTFGSREAFMTQVPTELSSGGGPDLFLLNYGTMLNWNKMAKNGVYENLSPYIKKDKSYKADAYFEPVIKAGQIDGNQYVMPLSFNTISLFSSKEKMAANGVNLEKGYSYKDVLAALNAAVEKANQNDEIIPIMLSIDRTDFLSCFMQAFGMPIIDYKKEQPALDKDSLLELCDFMKGFYPYAIEAFVNKNEDLYKSQNIKNAEYILDTNGYVGIDGYLNAVMNIINEESVAITMPRYDNPNESTGYVYHYAAVNSNSKNKQLAYDTTKALMDMASRDGIGRKFPINISAFDDWVTTSNLMNWNYYIDGEYIPSNEQIDAEKIKKFAQNLKYITMENVDVMDIVNNGMMPYIEGTQSFDECYEETVSKLNLYINE